MSKKQKREVEYKDTNAFVFTPRYQYSPAVSNRYLFFWDTANHYKRVFNYAENFVRPNRIIAVYLIGTDCNEEKLAKQVSEFPGSFLLIRATGIDDVRERVEKCVSDLNDAKVRGYTAEGARTDLDKFDRAVEQGLMSREETIYQYTYDAAYAFEHTDEWLGRCRTAWNDSLSVTGSFTGKIRGDDEGHMQDLTDIAKMLFPLGIEYADPPPLAYKSARTNKLCENAAQGGKEFGVDPNEQFDPRRSILQFDGKAYKSAPIRYVIKPAAVYPDKETASAATGVDVNAIWRCVAGRTDTVKCGATRCAFAEQFIPADVPKEFIRYVRQRVHDDIWNLGGCNIVHLKEELQKPPFGYYECNWYAYLLATALYAFSDGRHHAYIGILDMDMNAVAVKLCATYSAFTAHRSTDESCIVYKLSTRQSDALRILRRLFDIKRQTDDLQETLRLVRDWCCNNMRIATMDICDDGLYRIVRGHDHFQSSHYGYEDILLDIGGRFDSVYAALRTADDTAVKYIGSELGGDAAERYREYVLKTYDTGHARAWLWDKSDILREATRLKNDVYCAECGNLICNITKYDPNERVEIDITANDCIALNRKLINKDMTKFYCSCCLAEMLETTEFDLMQKIAMFKEQGCTLF